MSKRRKSKKKDINIIPKLESWKKNYFLTGEIPEGIWQFHRWNPLPNWKIFGQRLTAEWIQDHPGTRPFGWWEHSSPGLRERVGGKGSPEFEVLNIEEEYIYGVPDAWVSALSIYCWPDLKEYAVDPEDPPAYESQASFLKKHNLLSNSEIERLSDKDFEPEKLNISYEGELDF